MPRQSMEHSSYWNGRKQRIIEWQNRWTSSTNDRWKISLRGTGDNVLEEISVTRDINNGGMVFGCFEFPQSNIFDTKFSGKIGGQHLQTTDGKSAWEVPVIIFLVKSPWPGESIIVTYYLDVSNFHKEISLIRGVVL